MSALDRLRQSSPALADLTESHVEGLSDAELDAFAVATKMRKEAVHGRGDTLVPSDFGSSPYKTGPLVNFPGGEFGGRWRKNFPGAGGMHINDVPGEEKQTAGEAAKGDFDQKHKEDRINELISQDKYVVRFEMNNNEKATEDLAKEIFGEDGQSDGKSIFVLVDGYENALSLLGNVPGATVTRKGADR